MSLASDYLSVCEGKSERERERESEVVIKKRLGGHLEAEEASICLTLRAQRLHYRLRSKDLGFMSPK